MAEMLIFLIFWIISEKYWNCLNLLLNALLTLLEHSEIIKNTIRNVDFLGRYGGEEFMAILPGIYGEEAFILAQRIRKKISSNIIETDKGNLLLTISIGVSTYSTKDKSLEDIILRADQAVYEAKQQGRNKCCSIYSNLK